MQSVISNKDNLAEIDTNSSTLSIRITSGGLSFFIATQNKEIFTVENDNLPIFETTFLKTKVINATHKALLIPCELFDANFSANYLKIAGVPKSDNEIIIDETHGDVTLIMAIDEKLKSDLDQKFNLGLIYTHPLMVCAEELCGGANILSVYTTPTYVFLVLYSGGKMVYSDVLPSTDFPSLLFCVNRAIVNNKAGKFKIVCSGDNCGENADNLKRYYQDVECNFNIYL